VLVMINIRVMDHCLQKKKKKEDKRIFCAFKHPINQSTKQTK
jgi:hypothetical protein